MKYIVHLSNHYSYIMDNNLLTLKPEYNHPIKKVFILEKIYRDAIRFMMRLSACRLDGDLKLGEVFYDGINFIPNMTETEYHKVNSISDNHLICFSTMIDTNKCKFLLKECIPMINDTFLFDSHFYGIDLSENLHPDYLHTDEGRSAIKNGIDMSVYRKARSILGGSHGY